MANRQRFAFVTALLLLALTAGVRADVNDKVYSVGVGTRNIYLVNANGSVTSQFTTYNATASAAMAQRASDGLIFFTTNALDGTLLSWNPATPATAPISIGATGLTTPALTRLAFNSAGTLYAMDGTTQTLYTVNTATGAATSAATLSGVPVGAGDFAFGPDGILYMVIGTTLYTVPTGGGAITSLGAITGMAGTATGVAFDSTGTLLVCNNANPAAIYSVNISTLVATALTNTMTTTQGDLASAPKVKIQGTVFEDVNYGGGAGRSLATSAGVGRSGVRVELYDSAGAFVIFTTTDASGNYTLAGVANKTYTVRVVDSTVTSSRPGSVGTLVGVQTFRTSGLTGTVGTADTNRVGGEDPTQIDSGSNTTNLALGSIVAQSVTPITLGASSVTGIDFGFNFDTIVSTRDAGQGSLRQFVTNSNTLTNAGLAQSGFTSGIENSIFMISGGAAVPGLRAGLTNQLSSGVASIVITSAALPAITDTNTTIDGTIQTTNVGDTNAGTLGIGGTVGVDGISLPVENKPEVQVSAARAAFGIGFDVNANNTTIRGISMLGFGTGANSNGSANIQIESGKSGTLIEKNFLGFAATSAFVDPGAATRGIGDNIRSVGGTNGTIQNNLIGFAEGKGMGIESASTGWIIQHNEVRGNGINNSNLDGVDIENSSGDTVQQNLFIANWGTGVDSFSSTGSNTIVNNTVTGNGVGTGANLEDMGIRIYGTGSTVDRNIVNANVGAGVLVTSGSTNNVITKNSIFSNGTVGATPTGEIGIDLENSTDNASLGTTPFVTINDSGDGDTGGNNLLNYPILVSATVNNGQLTLKGFARPGSSIELFIAQPAANGFGQGKTYLTTLVEGSASDNDATTGTYGPAAINGIAQGTDTTNKFSFTVNTPAGVSVGTVLTSTATLASNTSEFSGNVTVALSTDISGKVYLDTNHNGTADTGEDWTSGSSVFVNLVQGASVVQSITVPVGAGTFDFPNVAAGAYTLVLTNTAVATTPVVPAGFIFVSPTAGSIPVNASNGTLTNQNFGLFKGIQISGNVFKDDGTGGGTANNGVKDGGEVGLPGITVRATNQGATTYDTTVTDPSGNYVLNVPSTATTIAIIETNASTYISTGGTTPPGGTYTRATDTMAFTSTGISVANLNFGDVQDNSFEAGGSQQVQPGSTIFYQHTFVAGSVGSVTLSLASVTSPANLPFGRTIYGHVIAAGNDCTGALDPLATVVTSAVSIPTAGSKLCVWVKINAPPGTPFNSDDATTVNASFAYANSAIVSPYSLKDDTIVGTATNSGLKLIKSVDKLTATPGTVITYTVTFTNDSSGALANIVVNDATPAYTTFVSASCGAPLPTNLTSCNITAPSAGATGSIKWTFGGTLSPSLSGTVTFSVQIQ